MMVTESEEVQFENYRVKGGLIQITIDLYIPHSEGVSYSITTYPMSKIGKEVVWVDGVGSLELWVVK